MIGGTRTKEKLVKMIIHSIKYINKENNDFRVNKIGGFSNFSLVTQQFTYSINLIGIYTCINVLRPFQNQ